MKQAQLIIILIIVFIICRSKSSFGATEKVNLGITNKTGSAIGVVYTSNGKSKTTIVNNGSTYKVTVTKGADSIKLIPIGVTTILPSSVSSWFNASTYLNNSTWNYDITIKSNTLSYNNATTNIPTPTTTGPECASSGGGGGCSIM